MNATEYEPDSKPSASAPPLYDDSKAPPAAFYTYAANGNESSMIFDDPSSTGHTLEDFLGSTINHTLDELEEDAAQAARDMEWNQTVDPMKYRVTHLAAPPEVRSLPVRCSESLVDEPFVPCHRTSLTS